MTPFQMASPLYPPQMTIPMEAELTQLGVTALHTVEEVNRALSPENGTVFLIVNSVCGCGAGCARPAVKIALEQSKNPPKMVTVFAGVDVEATKRAREFVKEYSPSSPSFFLLKNGKCVFSLERHQIQGRDPHEIAEQLLKMFDTYA